MKKNKMMRLASGLLVAVLLTTSMISGTFAKYVTSADANDTARVAKWGVEVTASTNAFATKYETKATDDAAALSVEATEKVIAPGTNSAEVGEAFQFTISGTPEVATLVTIEIENIKDIFLANGEYTDWTKSPYTGKFKVNEAAVDGRDVAGYYPVKWTLTVEDQNPVGTTIIADKVSLQEVEDLVNAYVASARYAPNEKLDATFTLSWEWDFEGNDQADTLLGNLAAGTDTTVATENYNLVTSFDFTVTVTQID